jgi:4-hydroxythreonine-4-phosphate dehydrogenase
MTLFKKIDSTLRGHIGVEIGAALETLKPLDPIAIVAPSFPETGRVLRGGRAYLNGAPLEETPLWRQEKMRGDADLVAMLVRAGLKAALSAPDAMAAMNKKDVLVCDAQNATDLDAIVKAGRKLGRTILWVGAGGLARALAQAEKKPSRARPRLAPVKGTILFLVGSQSPVSRAQATDFAADAALVHVTADMLRGPLPPERKRDVALMLDCAPQADPHALAHAFATWAAPQVLLAEALFLTGGETAHAVLWRLGAHGLRLLGEVAPGVTLCRAEGGAIHGRIVITKAGGFGEADIMRRCRDVLRGRATPRPKKMARDSRPRIAITMGDAAGVGPEVIMKALAHRDLYKSCRPLVTGDAARLREAGRLVGSKLKVRDLAPDALAMARYEPGTVDCLDPKLLPAGLPFGRLSPVAGHAAYEYVRLATGLAMEHRIEAICTAPLNKEALHAGGHVFPGHTELLAALTQTPEVSMMLTAPGLRVIHVTAHIGLLDAVKKIEPALVERTIARGMDVLVKAVAAAQDRGVRHQSPCRREWVVRPWRGGGEDHPRRGSLPQARLGRGGAAARRHPVLSRQPRRF